MGRWSKTGGEIFKRRDNFNPSVTTWQLPLKSGAAKNWNTTSVLLYFVSSLLLFLSPQERSGSCGVGLVLVDFCFHYSCYTGLTACAILYHPCGVCCLNSVKIVIFILLYCFCHYVANGRTLFVVQSHCEVLPRLACMSCILPGIAYHCLLE